MAVGILGSLVINIDGTVYEDTYILTDIHEFIKCVFMYQIGAYQFLKEEINTIGIVILEILITASVWFLNVIIFVLLIAILILKTMCHLFWLVFRKRNKD